MEFKLTKEQEAVVEHVCHSKNSLRVEALAGAAKTTTIEHAIKARGGEGVLAIAFNKKIATALSERLPTQAACMTLNAMGHRAWGSYTKKKLQLDTSKTYHILNEVMNHEHIHEDEYLEVAANLRGLVTAAKVAGLVPTGAKGEAFAKSFFDDTEENWEALGETYDCDTNPEYIRMARSALKISIGQALNGNIDFNDQLYMSTCWEAPFAKFPLVVVDEAQDLSALNHQMIAKCIGHGGKLVAIGDRYQSIYAFRGADLNSMDRLAARFKMDTLTLNTTFRCSLAVADHVRDRVPYIQSPSWAKPGAVERLESWTVDDIPAQSAVICARNKPLIQLAYKFIAAGKPVVINGGDFGEMLIKLLRKIAGATSKSETANTAALRAMECGALADAIKVWEETEIANARAKNKAYRISGIEDKAGSLITVIRSCRGKNALDILTELRQVFDNKVGSVVLSSGHKSKGLEWENVFHLNSFLLPSKWAKRAAEEGDTGQLEQDLNLQYVISTRAKNRLVYIDLEKEPKQDEAGESNPDVVDDLDIGNADCVTLKERAV